MVLEKLTACSATSPGAAIDGLVALAWYPIHQSVEFILTTADNRTTRLQLIPQEGNP
jgi:hypothetical protein